MIPFSLTGIGSDTWAIAAPTRLRHHPRLFPVERNGAIMANGPEFADNQSQIGTPGGKARSATCHSFVTTIDDHGLTDN